MGSDGAEVVIPGRREHVRFGDGARRDHADDFALHHRCAGTPGAAAGVLAPRRWHPRLRRDLLADGHPLAGGNQAGDIRIGGMCGHSGHRHAIAAAHFARREGDLQQPRRPLRVVVEGLVEVTQPEEQDGVRVLALEPQVLAT